MRGLLCLFLATVVCGAAAADPEITDKAAAQRLLGAHAITLQWIGSGTLRDAGTATVTQQGGEWRLSGRMDAQEGFVAIDGAVTKIEQSSFTFQGRIVTKVTHIYDGKECSREGTFQFIRKGSRKYWRMYPIDNPCDTAADYIDIYQR